MNKYVEGVSVDMESDMVLLFEGEPGWNQVGGPELVNTKNHDGYGFNVLYTHTYVNRARSDRIEKLPWKVDERKDEQEQ